MASSTNNPRVFPMTLFYDDKAPLDQETKPTHQNPNSSEFPSQEPMRPNENASQLKGDTLNSKSYKAGVANIFGRPFEKYLWAIFGLLVFLSWPYLEATFINSNMQ